MLIYLKTDEIAARYLIESAQCPASFKACYFKNKHLIIEELDLFQFLKNYESLESGVLVTDEDLIVLENGVCARTGFLRNWRAIKSQIEMSAISTSQEIDPPINSELDVIHFFLSNFGWKSWKLFDDEIGSLIYFTPSEVVLCSNLFEFLVLRAGDQVAATTGAAIQDFFDNWKSYSTLSGEIRSLYPDFSIIEEGDDWSEAYCWDSRYCSGWIVDC